MQVSGRDLVGVNLGECKIDPCQGPARIWGKGAILNYIPSFLSPVIPTTTLQLAGGGDGGSGMHGSNAGQMQYISGQEFYVPAGESLPYAFLILRWPTILCGSSRAASKQSVSG